ncbi:MAG TPA: endonuclease/exonuclease/phosphatase family protein, partial [Aliiroseovarius sp.]|nr:endonuclease/exonuclease/phosphatase family protein [Aliiroseovarius sp.]
MAAGLIRFLLLTLLLAGPLRAETLRIATYHTDLSRKGPGLLLRDILRAKDPQIAAVINVIKAVEPDVILLLKFDYDLNNQALTDFRDALAAAGGPDYPYLFARLPNSGMATGLDMDNNGRLNEPRDAQGYGRFSGQGGMAVLSRLPIATDAARDFSGFLWRDLPGALLPMREDGPFLSPEATAVQRLSSVAHWQVPIRLPAGGLLNLLAFHATTPVFDGPEDRNGRRNHDEVLFWPLLLDVALPFAPPEAPFVILGDANLDANAGEGLKGALTALLEHPAVQDPRPTSRGAEMVGDATDTTD